MVRHCILCKNYYEMGTEITYHKLPASEDVKMEWYNVIPPEKAKRNPKNIYVCSVHFTPECYLYSSLLEHKKVLNKNAIPTLVLPTIKSQNLQRISPSSSPNIENCPPISDTTTVFESENVSSKNAAIQVELRELYVSKMEKKLRAENIILKKRLRRRDEKISSLQEFIKAVKRRGFFNEDSILAEHDYVGSWGLQTKKSS